MSRGLEGLNVLVTAAGDGIGRAVSLALAKEGASVIATNRSASKLEDLTSIGIAKTFELDVTNLDAVNKVASKIGALDALVNCAGLVKTDTLLNCTAQDLRAVLEINLIGTHNVIQTFLPKMIEAGGGSIVNIASIISSLKGAPDRFSYATSKGALLGLTKSVAVDYADKGIRCNAICPGTIETPSLSARIAQSTDPEAARQRYAARHPIGRTGKPEEVAALAVHLVSPESGFTTGQTFVLDGGWTA